jgi:hypothetical protein
MRKAADEGGFGGQYPRQESNLRLLAPEASALSTELRGLINGKRIAITLRRCQFTQSLKRYTGSIGEVLMETFEPFREDAPRVGW